LITAPPTVAEMAVVRLPRVAGDRNMDVVTTQAQPAGPTDPVAPLVAVADEPALSVAAVARRLGIAPATLRTWDRRYGVGPSGHATGRHRRYGSHDVARLELMQRALLRGASPAESARYARTATRLPHDTDPTEDAAVRGMLTGGEPSTHPRTGGPPLRLPGSGRLARGFGRPFLAMDSIAAQRLLGESIEADGVPRTWDDVVRPVLGAIAQRWTHSGASIEIEHLLYECVLAALIRATPLVTAPCNPRPVLLAGAPGEQHTLPLHALVATLAARGIGTRMLGPALPADALTCAIRKLAPAAVVLWAQLPRNADPALLTCLPRVRQRTRLFVGGPGWRVLDLDPRLALPDALTPAADEIDRTVR
jgi:MerR family transcriptional regulator, light-induced transcriptional regulator